MADVAPEITAADLDAGDLDLDLDSDIPSTEGAGDGDLAPEGDVDLETPALFTIKVAGEDKQVSQDELIRLAQMGDDYTRKTQALAEERKAIQALEQSFATDPDGTIEALRKLYGPAPTDTQNDDLALDPLEREVKELREFVESQKRQQVEARIDAEVATVRSTFNDPELDEQALFAYAAEHKIADLSDAYKAMKFDEVRAASAALAEAEARRVAAREAKKNAPVVEGGAKPPSRTITDGASDSLSVEESFLLALKQHGRK